MGKEPELEILRDAFPEYDLVERGDGRILVITRKKRSGELLWIDLKV